jgi:hypothetical protein
MTRGRHDERRTENESGITPRWVRVVESSLVDQRDERRDDDGDTESPSRDEGDAVRPSARARQDHDDRSDRNRADGDPVFQVRNGGGGALPADA